MNNLEDSFKTLLGRQPGDAEKQALFRARDAFHIKNNDALWLLLAILGHYEILYGKIPALIAESATTVTEKARTAAEAEFRAAGARVQFELAKSVAKAAREIAERAASARRSQWIAVCLIVAASTFIAVGGWAFAAGRRAGFDAGRVQGYGVTRDEKIAAAWVSTSEGRAAYSLAKAGSIHDLANCSGRGWRKQGSYCIPRDEKGAIVGWRLGGITPTKGTGAELSPAPRGHTESSAWRTPHVMPR